MLDVYAICLDCGHYVLCREDSDAAGTCENCGSYSVNTTPDYDDAQDVSDAVLSERRRVREAHFAAAGAILPPPPIRTTSPRPRWSRLADLYVAPLTIEREA